MRPTTVRTRRRLAFVAAALWLSACGRGEFDPDIMEPPIRVVDVQGASAFDPLDPEARAGWADAIFVGTVDRYLSTEAPGESTPSTQFEVTVVENLKAVLPLHVVVSQPGGSTSTGDLVIVNNTFPIEDGKTYLFSARINPEKGWFCLAPEQGAVALPNEITAATATEVVERDRIAVANQTPFGDEATRPGIPR